MPTFKQAAWMVGFGLLSIVIANQLAARSAVAAKVLKAA